MFRSLKRLREDDFDFPLDPKKFRPWKAPASPPEPADFDQALRFRAPTLTPIDSSDEEDSNTTHAFSTTLHTGTTTKVSNARPSTTSTHLNQPPKLLLSGEDISSWQQAQAQTHPSPIPHTLVHRSLDINDSALTAPGFGHDDPDPTTLTLKLAPTPTPTPTHPDTLMEDADADADADNFPETLPEIRLPSPVSDTDIPMAGTGTELEQEYPYRIPTPGLDYGNVSTQPVAAHPMSRNASRQSTPTPTPVPTQCPAPHAHRRSALVMGYRADCDKCRCKVPGHYSHIIER